MNKQLGHSTSVETCEIVNRRNVYGYSDGAGASFVKVTLNSPYQISKLCKIIKAGTIMGANDAGYECDTTTFESNLDFALRFMIDTKISGGSWIGLRAGKYSVRSVFTSHCQIEA